MEEDKKLRIRNYELKMKKEKLKLTFQHLKIKYFFIFIFLFFIISCTNFEDEIIGEWHLSAIKTNQKINNSQNYAKALKQLKASTSLTFKTDKSFHGKIWGDTSKGIWYIEQDGKNISIYDEITNKKINVKIQKLTSTKIVLIEKQDSIIVELTFVKL